MEFSSILLLVTNGRQICLKCTKADVRLPETCRVVIPIKLEFSASVGFIHKKNIPVYSNLFSDALSA